MACYSLYAYWIVSRTMVWYITCTFSPSKEESSMQILGFDIFILHIQCFLVTYTWAISFFFFNNDDIDKPFLTFGIKFQYWWSYLPSWCRLHVLEGYYDIKGMMPIPILGVIESLAHCKHRAGSKNGLSYHDTVVINNLDYWRWC